jgi:hypothetical protein
MPQLRLHRLDARALGDEQAGAGMAEADEAAADIEEVQGWGGCLDAIHAPHRGIVARADEG